MRIIKIPYGIMLIISILNVSSGQELQTSIVLAGKSGITTFIKRSESRSNFKVKSLNTLKAASLMDCARLCSSFKEDCTAFNLEGDICLLGFLGTGVTGQNGLIQKADSTVTSHPCPVFTSEAPNLIYLMHAVMITVAMVDRLEN